MSSAEILTVLQKNVRHEQARKKNQPQHRCKPSWIVERCTQNLFGGEKKISNTSVYWEKSWRIFFLPVHVCVTFFCKTLSALGCLLEPAQACRYHNQTGVEIRPYDWGGLTGVAALDPDAPAYSGTYLELINGLKDEGYQERKDLFGAPFDFRLNAEGLQQVTLAPPPPSPLGLLCSLPAA